GIGFACGNAVIIALYTLVDGIGVRLSGSAASYTLWLFFLDAWGILAIAWWQHGRVVLSHLRRRWRPALAGAVLTIGSYGIVLWAMTVSSIPAVAALREFSVVFAALLGAFIGMRQLGVSGNLMSLGAIDFGLIVDGAVIVIENAMRLIAERSHKFARALTPPERTQAVLDGSREVLRSTVFGVTIIAIVYLPILTLTDIEGKMFRPMAITVLLALVTSLCLALTVVPVLASLFLPSRVSEEEGGIVRTMRRWYEPWLEKALGRPRLAAGSAAALFVISLLVAPLLGAEFIPRLDEGSIALQAWRLPSVSLEESVRQTTHIEQTLKRFPEVTTVVSKTGRAEIATDPMGVEMSDILVMLRPHNEWQTASTRETL
ncbi:MAG: efflux RND transporter permease subunit, partial [Rhodospirillaceae bacterium]|nr:efflux RND transporter permease subunit [Rhodospirillaceae bacterium]